MSEVGNFFVAIGSKFDKKGFDKARAAINGVAKGALIMGAALAAAGYKAAKAAGIQERAELTLAQAMQQAGTYTKKAFEHNLKYASSLQTMTEYGDEAIIGVQKMLTNFGIEGEMLDSLTKATLDLAAAKGFSLTSAADLVAKSVGSSTNALTRYGIVVEGDVGSTKRMKMAVDNISKLFGGAAEANAQTFLGAMKQLGNTIGDLWEDVGFKLLPTLKEYIKIIKTNIVPRIKEWIDESGNIESVVEKLVAAVKLAATTAYSFAKTISFTIQVVRVASDICTSWGLRIMQVTAFLSGLTVGAKMFGIMAEKHMERAKTRTDELADSVAEAGNAIDKMNSLELKHFKGKEKAVKKTAAAVVKANKKEEKSTIDLMEVANDSARYTKELKDQIRQEEVIKNEEDDLLTMERRQMMFEGGMNLLSSFYDLKLQKVQNDTQQAIENEDAQYQARRDYIMNNVTDETQRKLQLDLLDAEHSATVDSLRKAGLEKEKAVKKKQKKLSIMEAIVNTSVGFTKALSQGGIFGIVLGAIVAAAGAVQIAMIKAQKFASGAMVMSATPAIFGESGAELALPLNHPNTTRLLSKAMETAGGGGGGNVYVTVPPVTSRRVAAEYGRVIGDAIFNKVKKSRRI